MDEVIAKLVTIEKLLAIVLSDSRYADLVTEAKSEIYEEYGTQLNRIFPSDPEYHAISTIVTNFNVVADEIELNHRYQVLK